MPQRASNGMTNTDAQPSIHLVFGTRLTAALALTAFASRLRLLRRLHIRAANGLVVDHNGNTKTGITRTGNAQATAGAVDAFPEDLGFAAGLQECVRVNLDIATILGVSTVTFLVINHGWNLFFCETHLNGFVDVAHVALYERQKVAKARGEGWAAALTLALALAAIAEFAIDFHAGSCRQDKRKNEEFVEGHLTTNGFGTSIISWFQDRGKLFDFGFGFAGGLQKNYEKENAGEIVGEVGLSRCFIESDGIVWAWYGTIPADKNMLQTAALEHPCKCSTKSPQLTLKTL